MESFDYFSNNGLLLDTCSSYDFNRWLQEKKCTLCSKINTEDEKYHKSCFQICKHILEKKVPSDIVSIIISKI